MAEVSRMNKPNRNVAADTVDSMHGGSGSSRISGFTLIELLVVVSIIALLISILLPSLKRSREQARNVKCLSNVRGMGQAGFIFSSDHRDRFQLAAAEEAINDADPGRNLFAYDDRREILSWPVAMAASSGLKGFDRNWQWGVRANNWNEAKDREQFMSQEFKLAVCPADRVKISTPFYPRGNSLRPLPDDQQNLPDGDSYWGLLSYGINEDVVGSDDGSGPVPDAPDCWRNGNRGQISLEAGPRLRGRLERVYKPATCLLLVDAGPDTQAQAASEPEGFANLIISAQTNGPDLEDFQVKWRKRMPLKRHPNSSLNVLFSDFHGENVKPTEFITTSESLRGIPKDYNTRVRVSPYKPWIENGN